MPLTGFLADLIASPRLKVPLPTPIEPSDRNQAKAILLTLDAHARGEAPGQAPDLDVEIAVWAGEMLYRVCQFLVFREVDGPVVERTLATACPKDGLCPSALWSADLTYRYLPDLLALARGLAPDDPLVKGLQQLLRRWPLACIRGETPDAGPLTVILAHPCLRQLYADRIIARQVTSALAHPDTAQAIRERLGIYPELAPAIVAALGVPDERKGSVSHA